MESNTNDRPKPVSYDIIIDGLVRLSDPEVKDPEFTSVALKLGKDEPISLVWSKLQGECCGPRCILLRVQIIDHLSAELHFRLPYFIKYGQGSATRQWSRTESKEVSRPYTEVEVVPKDIPSDYDKKRINVNDSFISFANLLHQGQSAKDVELRAEEPTVSANGAQKVVINNDLEIIFHRTLRIPNNNHFISFLPRSAGLRCSMLKNMLTVFRQPLSTEAAYFSRCGSVKLCGWASPLQTISSSQVLMVLASTANTHCASSLGISMRCLDLQWEKSYLTSVMGKRSKTTS